MIKNGNIFLSDYKMLDGLKGNVVHGRKQYLTAPLVLLYCNPEGLMLPIAIQVNTYFSKTIIGPNTKTTCPNVLL